MSQVVVSWFATETHIIKKRNKVQFGATSHMFRSKSMYEVKLEIQSVIFKNFEEKLDRFQSKESMILGES